MLRALYTRGIEPDLLVGTSVGALNAAFIASRPQTVATVDQLADIWCRLRRDDVFPLSVRALIVGLAGRRDHLVSDGAVRRLVHKHVQFTDIAHAAIPLHVVAFDTDAQAEVLLSAGPAVDAITAAASIPGVFPPVRVGERSLIDGGVANNTPLSHAVALGAERVFVLPTRDQNRGPARCSRGALAAAIDGLGVLTDARLQFDLQRFSTTAELIILPCPNAHGVQPPNFDHASTLIRDAFDAATGSWQKPMAFAHVGGSLAGNPLKTVPFGFPVACRKLPERSAGTPPHPAHRGGLPSRPHRASDRAERPVAKAARTPFRKGRGQPARTARSRALMVDIERISKHRHALLCDGASAVSLGRHRSTTRQETE